MDAHDQPAAEVPKNGDNRPTHSEDGVDLTLIRWMLSLTYAERLAFLQNHIRAIAMVRDANPNL